MHPAHGDVLALLGAAVTSFFATNVDALAILTPMLWSVRTCRKRCTVLIGCSLGNATVLAVALLTAEGLDIVPEDQLRWLGIVPIAMGIGRLLPRRGSGGGRARDAGELGEIGGTGVTDDATSAGSAAELLGGVGPVALLDAGTATATTNATASASTNSTSADSADPAVPRTDQGTAKALFAHAGLTVVLGGDNIAVLAPLLRALGTGDSAIVATTHLILFPLFLALPAFATRFKGEVPRLARPASACLSIVIGTVIVAG